MQMRTKGINQSMEIRNLALIFFFLIGVFSHGSATTCSESCKNEVFQSLVNFLEHTGFCVS